MYSGFYLGVMAKKLGYISKLNKEKDSLNDKEFDSIRTLFEVMSKCGTDFTNTFRTLALISRNTEITETDE
jgi:uncharacterized protein YdiU (UPF0061 family)